jgi:hypothetical protein
MYKYSNPAKRPQLPEPPSGEAIDACLVEYEKRYNNQKFLDLETYVQEVVARKFPMLDERDCISVTSAIMNRVINETMRLCDRTRTVFPAAHEQLQATISFYQSSSVPGYGSLIGTWISVYVIDFLPRW